MPKEAKFPSFTIKVQGYENKLITFPSLSTIMSIFDALLQLLFEKSDYFFVLFCFYQCKSYFTCTKFYCTG